MHTSPELSSETLVAISGPSGAGKNYIAQTLVDITDGKFFIVPKLTTRELRPGEEPELIRNVTPEQLHDLDDRGEIVEIHAQYGNLYACAIPDVMDILQKDKVPVCDWSIRSVDRLRVCFPGIRVHSVYVMPSIDELRARLVKSDRDPLGRRLREGISEMHLVESGYLSPRLAPDQIISNFQSEASTQVANQILQFLNIKVQ